MNPEITIISPVYRCSPHLELLTQKIIELVKSNFETYEILYIEDNGPDNSWEVITKLCSNNPNVKGLRLSRNFGQQYALDAGYNYAKGKWILTLDCDLQDDPSEAEKLIQKSKEGFDIVLASRGKRKDSLVKTLASKLFYSAFSYLTNTKQDGSVANFTLINQKVLLALLSMKDYFKYYPAMIQWVGFKQAKVEIVHRERPDKFSSYSFKKRINLALDTILSFSDKPIRLVVKTGFLLTLFAMFYAFYSIIRFLNGDIAVSGWTSMFISIWLSTGIIISVLGMVGLYIGKSFDTLKQRPTFIVSETINIQ